MLNNTGRTLALPGGLSVLALQPTMLDVGRNKARIIRRPTQV